MKKVLILIVIPILFICGRQVLIGRSVKSSLDINKLVDKNWMLKGTETPQFMTINFQSNDTAVVTQFWWSIEPYKFKTKKLFWEPIGKDSINLDGVHFRVYLLTDSVLQTNNWMFGGPGVSDTIRQTFKVS